MSLELLKRAIELRAPITFEYGTTPGERKGNPHMVFTIKRKDGVETTKVEIDQTAGASKSGVPFPSWRRFDLDKLNVLAVHEEDAPFKQSEEYNPESLDYQFVIARI